MCRSFVRSLIPHSTDTVGSTVSAKCQGDSGGRHTCPPGVQAVASALGSPGVQEPRGATPREADIPAWLPGPRSPDGEGAESQAGSGQRGGSPGLSRQHAGAAGPRAGLGECRWAGLGDGKRTQADPRGALELVERSQRVLVGRGGQWSMRKGLKQRRLPAWVVTGPGRGGRSERSHSLSVNSTGQPLSLGPPGTEAPLLGRWWWFPGAVPTGALPASPPSGGTQSTVMRPCLSTPPGHRSF